MSHKTASVKKTFLPGERVEFQREPHANWETGIYVKAYSESEFPGWHRVKDVGFGAGHTVPARRVRKSKVLK